MMSRCTCRALCFFLVCAGFCIPSIAAAHPHVWVDYYVNGVADKTGITKLKFRWHFDDMFTSMVTEDFHVQNLGTKTIEELKEKAFSNLSHYHYYMHVNLDGQEFLPEDVSDFNAEMKGHNLEYTFTINLPKPTKKLELSLYDPEFYVDIGPPVEKIAADRPGIMAPAKLTPKDFVTSSAENGATPPNCKWEQGEPRISKTWGKFAVFRVLCEVR